MSGAEVARRLGTSLPRVVRAAERLGVGTRLANGRLRFATDDVRALRGRLGVTVPVAGLAAVDVQVLAALSRAPRGVRSLRELARRARVSPTTASRSARRLRDRGLIREEPRMVAEGGARQVTVLHANRRSSEWPELRPSLHDVELPRVPSVPGDRVPTRLRHLFWNTAPNQLDVATAGPYIARRLIRTMDVDGLAWGADALGADAWRHAAATRGIDDRERALARNLAEAADG